MHEAFPGYRSQTGKAAKRLVATHGKLVLPALEIDDVEVVELRRRLQWVPGYRDQGELAVDGAEAHALEAAHQAAAHADHLALSGAQLLHCMQHLPKKHRGLRSRGVPGSLQVLGPTLPPGHLTILDLHPGREDPDPAAVMVPGVVAVHRPDHVHPAAQHARGALVHDDLRSGSPVPEVGPGQDTEGAGHEAIFQVTHAKHVCLLLHFGKQLLQLLCLG